MYVKTPHLIHEYKCLFDKKKSQLLNRVNSSEMGMAGAKGQVTFPCPTSELFEISQSFTITNNVSSVLNGELESGAPSDFSMKR